MLKILIHDIVTDHISEEKKPLAVALIGPFYGWKSIAVENLHILLWKFSMSILTLR